MGPSLYHSEGPLEILEGLAWRKTSWALQLSGSFLSLLVALFCGDLFAFLSVPGQQPWDKLWSQIRLVL